MPSTHRLFRLKWKISFPSHALMPVYTNTEEKENDEHTDATDVLGLEGLNDGLTVHQRSTRSIKEHHALHGRTCVREPNASHN